MEDTALADLFSTLAKIPSPSGQEDKMATFLKDYFQHLGWQVVIDESGPINHSTTGNVYAYLEVDKRFPTVAFSAHMDTVQKEGDTIQVQFDGKVFTSDGSTILGADNKAGVATLLAVAHGCAKNKLNHNILFFFPTREEAGKMGSSLFKNIFESSIIAFFNIDAGGPPGTFVFKSLGYENFTITLTGLSAHAAKDYDLGKDAIVAAGKLITALPIGKNTTEGTTFNVGEISGGKASNIVSDFVEMRGEFRGFTKKSMQKIKQSILLTCQAVEEETGVKIAVEFDAESLIPPFAGDEGSPIANKCREAGKALGFDAVFKESYSSSDANYYSSLGYPAISVCRGSSGGHTVRETLQLADLKQAVQIVNFLASN